MQLDRPLRTVTSSIDAEILGLLASVDYVFSARKVHLLLGEHSESGVRKALDRLVEQGTVSMQRGGQAKLYKLNRDHLAAPYVIGLAHMKDQLVGLLRERLAQWSPRPTTAVLFGSAARGAMRPDSDIDIFIVRPDAVGADEDLWRTQVALLEQDVATWTGNDVRVLELSESETVASGLRDGSVVADIRASGIMVHGELPRARQRTRHG
jgi:predicted nucleotidyltransferase